jgi:hypothetical protein
VHLFYLFIFVIGFPFSIGQERFDVENHHQDEPDRSENHDRIKDGQNYRVFFKKNKQA